MKLFPFQAQDVKLLLNSKQHWIIGNSPGLGKTIEMGAYLRVSQQMPALIICPATIKTNWQRELAKFGITNVEQLSGRTSHKLNKKVQAYIINYDIIFSWVETFRAHLFKTIIADEVQYVANKKAKRTKAFIAICRGIKARRFFLSGTPYTSKPNTFFTSLNLVNSKNFPSVTAFENKYCIKQYNGFGWGFSNKIKNGEELYALIAQNMIRHTKEQVLKDLPPKLISLIELPVDKEAFAKYLELEAKIKTLTEEELKKLGWHGHYVNLKRAAFAAKKQAAMQWIQDFIDSEIKLVVFCQHLEVYYELMKKFEKVAVGICGDVTKDRDAIVQKFQTDEKTLLFVGQINAAGVGITLTAASTAVFLEFADTATAHEQASDRVHRIGATAECINIYYLVAPGTIEGKIANRLITQNETRQLLMDGKVAGNQLFGDDFAESIFKDYAQRDTFEFL